VSDNFPNLSDIITITLRNRTGPLTERLKVSNRFLQAILDPWKLQEPGTVSLPDFARLSAEGKAKMKDGKVYLLNEQE